MAYKTDQFRGSIGNGIRCVDERGETLFSCIQTALPETLREKGIPAQISADVVKSGGVFGTKSPILLVRHPNPPSRFFDIGIVVNDNIITFHLLGESAQNTKVNKQEMLRESGKLLRASFVKPDEFILQQEESWQQEVVDAVQGLFT